MANAKVNGYTLREKVYQKLFEAIIVGRLMPGERILEEEISSKLEISRTPVRQAMRKLEEQNLIKIIPYKGAVVSEISYEEAVDLLEMCKVMEEFLCEKAAKNASREDIEKIKETLDKYQEAYRNGDFEGMQMMNFQFHTLISKSAGNKLAESVYRNIRARMNLISLITLPFSNRDRLTFQEHREIAEAIEQGDPERAKKSAIKHIEGVTRVTLEKIKDKKDLF